MKNLPVPRLPNRDDEVCTYRLRKEVSELCVVEDVEVTPGGDLADGVGVPAVPLVAVLGLDEDGAVAEADSVHLPLDVLQVYSFTWEHLSLDYYILSLCF